VALSKLFEHRYKFDAKVYNIQKKAFEEVTIFLDTGCYNTMIPRHLAENIWTFFGVYDEIQPRRQSY
ncbi:hypothetical protein, partial [Treponema sp. R8-4-B8]